MTETNYPRSLSGDFSNGLNSAKLTVEIGAEASISVELLRIDTYEDVVDIWFAAALSTEEEASLNVVIAAHDGLPFSSVKIYRYMPSAPQHDPTVTPVDHNYKTGLDRSLKGEFTIVKGELVNTKWYAEYDVETDIFSDLVINVGITYTRNELGLALYRETTRTWYLEDGTPASPTKFTSKPYRGNERTAELECRAKNAIAMQNTLGLGKIIYDQMTNHGKTQSEAIGIGLGYASAWYTHFEANILEFQRTNSRMFWDAIQALAYPGPLDWAHETPDFLTTVSAEINFGGWV